MTEWLEERGIKVLLVDLPESISGLTCSVRQSHDTGRVSVIVVNTGHSLERRRPDSRPRTRFTLCWIQSLQLITKRLPRDLRVPSS